MSEVQKRTNIWQVEGNLVYKLRESGIRGSEIQYENEFSFLVQFNPDRGCNLTGPARQMKANLMAQHVANSLNTNSYFESEDKSEELATIPAWVIYDTNTKLFWNRTLCEWIAIRANTPVSI